MFDGSTNQDANIKTLSGSQPNSDHHDPLKASTRKRKVLSIDDNGKHKYFEDYSQKEASRFDIAKLNLPQRLGFDLNLDAQYNSLMQTYQSNSLLSNNQSTNATTNAVDNLKLVLLELSQMIALTRELKSGENMKLQVFHQVTTESRGIPLPTKQAISIKREDFSVATTKLRNSHEILKKQTSQRAELVYCVLNLMRQWNVTLPTDQSPYNKQSSILVDCSYANSGDELKSLLPYSCKLTFSPQSCNLQLSPDEVNYPLKTLQFSIFADQTIYLPESTPHVSISSWQLFQQIKNKLLYRSNITQSSYHNITNITPSSEAGADTSPLSIEEYLRMRQHDCFSRRCMHYFRSEINALIDPRVIAPSEIEFSVPIHPSVAPLSKIQSACWSVTPPLLAPYTGYDSDKSVHKLKAAHLITSKLDEDSSISSSSNLQFTEIDSDGFALHLSPQVIIRVSLVPLRSSVTIDAVAPTLAFAETRVDGTSICSESDYSNWIETALSKSVIACHKDLLFAFHSNLTHRLSQQEGTETAMSNKNRDKSNASIYTEENKSNSAMPTEPHVAPHALKTTLLVRTVNAFHREWIKRKLNHVIHSMNHQLSKNSKIRILHKFQKPEISLLNYVDVIDWCKNDLTTSDLIDYVGKASTDTLAVEISELCSGSKCLVRCVLSDGSYECTPWRLTETSNDSDVTAITGHRVDVACDPDIGLVNNFDSVCVDTSSLLQFLVQSLLSTLVRRKLYGMLKSYPAYWVRQVSTSVFHVYERCDFASILAAALFATELEPVTESIGQPVVAQIILSVPNISTLVLKAYEITDAMDVDECDTLETNQTLNSLKLTVNMVNKVDSNQFSHQTDLSSPTPLIESIAAQLRYGSDWIVTITNTCEVDVVFNVD